MLPRIVYAPLRRMNCPAWIWQGYNKMQVRSFTVSTSLKAIRPFLLADIGEGITECQIMSWAVKEGETIQQFDTICEVQSDKASVEITSRFDGKITHLHYREGQMAKVGSALVDIDVSEEASFEDTPLPLEPLDQNYKKEEEAALTELPDEIETIVGTELVQHAGSSNTNPRHAASEPTHPSLLATPAVRRVLREYGISIADIQGTGKYGRVLKHDVTRHMERATRRPHYEKQGSTSHRNDPDADSGNRRLELSPIQNHMFKSMTLATSIPHFLYSHTLDLTALAELIKYHRDVKELSSYPTDDPAGKVKLTLLPFILKALSQAAGKYPVVNSLLDIGEPPDGPPSLLIKKSHDFGLAVDTPNGLLVPIIREVQNHSVLTLAAEISRLSKLAKAGKLSPGDMNGASLTISNIGSIGGNVVAPVILSPMTVILAIGQMEEVPAFEVGKDGVERIVKKMKAVLSWSADHRVHDGATIARCAQEMATWLERPEMLGLVLK